MLTVTGVRWPGRVGFVPPRRAHPPFDPAEFHPALQTNQLVLQPTPFCNIDCSYCYLTERDTPVRMLPATARLAVQRLREDGLLGNSLSVCWHAGEPLVMPPAFYREACAAVDEAAGAGCTVQHSVQTNATLVNDSWCHLLTDLRFQVGVSIDGPAFLHDAKRRTRRGEGTHARVMRGIACLQAHGIAFDAIAVVTARTLAHADAFADFFEALGARELGCNIDEVEGANAVSSLDGLEGAHRGFLRRLFERAAASGGRLVLREQQQARALVEHQLPMVHWRGQPLPLNVQALPLAIVTVAHDGAFGCFSPELLGQRLPGHGSWALGNLDSCGFLESTRREPFGSLWDAIHEGVMRCRRECAYFEHCGGGAPGNKLCENGDLRTTETLYCRTMVQHPFDLALADAEATWLHRACGASGGALQAT